MSAPNTEQRSQQVADDYTAAAAEALTAEKVEEQIRDAETLHRSLTEKLSTTAKE